MRYFVQGWLKQDIESCTVSVGGFAFTEQFSSDAMTYISYGQELTPDALLQGSLKTWMADSRRFFISLKGVGILKNHSNNI